jgi:hypothetical protein
MLEEETYSAALTCETLGCDNAGETIHMDIPVYCDAAACGVCGEPIPIVLL